MKSSKSVIIIPILKLFIIYFAVGILTQGAIQDSEGFWLYFYLIHLIAPAILGFLGSLTGVAFFKSKVKPKSEINKNHCLIVWRISVIFVLLLVISWFIILIPNLLSLLSKELFVGIFLSCLFLLLVLGAAFLVTFVTIPTIWKYGGILLVFFNRKKAIIILSIITILGFSLGYKMTI